MQEHEYGKIEPEYEAKPKFKAGTLALGVERPRPNSLEAGGALHHRDQTMSRVNRVIDTLVLDALQELADVEEQRRLWLAASGPEISSFIECTERLWDDSGLDRALERALREGNSVYTPTIDRLLRTLDVVLRKVNGYQPRFALLADKNLDEARRIAGQLLTELQPLV